MQNTAHVCRYVFRHVFRDTQTYVCRYADFNIGRMEGNQVTVWTGREAFMYVGGQVSRQIVKASLYQIKGFRELIW